MSALSAPQVSKLLDHLFAEAARNDPAAFDRFDGAESNLGRPASGRLRAELMSDIYSADYARRWAPPLCSRAQSEGKDDRRIRHIIRDFRHPSCRGIARRRRRTPHYDRIQRH